MTVFIYSLIFFSHRLLVLKNNKIELHSYIALPCKRLQTVKNNTTTTIIFTWVSGDSGQLLAVFSPIPPLAPQRATLFLLVRAEIVQWLPSQPYRLERGVFETKKSAPGRHFVWFCNICDSPVTLREVTTSRKLPGKLPEKLTGSKIPGASRNTRRVYGDIPGDLRGPIIYRVFRETGPWC